MRSKRLKTVLPQDVLQALLEASAPIAPEPERARHLRGRLLRQARASKQAGLTTVLKDKEGWTRLGPLVEMKLLRSDKESRSYLLKLHPGAMLPPHQHTLEEECLMLEGEVWIGNIHLRAGDYHVAAKGARHQEIRTTTGGLAFMRGAHPDEIGAVTKK